MNYTWATDGRQLLIARGNTNNDLILIRDGDKSGPSATASYPASRRRTTFEIFGRVFDDLR